MNSLCFNFLVVCSVLLLAARPAHAYLDPGTGSYVFQALIAVLLGALFAVKTYGQRLKNFFTIFFSKK